MIEPPPLPPPPAAPPSICRMLERGETETALDALFWLRVEVPLKVGELIPHARICVLAPGGSVARFGRAWAAAYRAGDERTRARMHGIWEWLCALHLLPIDHTKYGALPDLRLGGLLQPHVQE
jgi:hypothetical protein